MNHFLKIALFSALALSVSSQAHAFGDKHEGHGPNYNQPDCPNTAPEVDPSMAIGGLTMLGGTLAVLRARRSK
jgi:LPXTG-motif cell wall-anchored protein